MPLPTQGAIKMSDVKTDLNSTDFSLRAYSAAFNLTTPDSMSEFYGLSGSGNIVLTPQNSLVDTAYTFYSAGTATTHKTGSVAYPINTTLKLVYASPACSVTKDGVAYASGTEFTIALGTTITFILKNADNWVNTSYSCDTTTSATECFEKVTQTNDCGSTRTINYANGTACNRVASYTGTKVGVKCYGCTDVDIFQNQNKCYTGTNKYYSGYNGGTYYTTDPSDGGCDRVAAYTSNIGSYCQIVGTTCTKITVAQNTKTCFTGNQFRDSLGNTYSTNPSTHGYNESPCSTAVTLVNTGYTTCVGCSNVNSQKDNNPCSGTYNKYYVNGSLYGDGSTLPPTASCDTAASYSLVGTRCYDFSNWTVYVNSNACYTGNNQYKLTSGNETLYFTVNQYNASVSGDCCWVADPACQAGTCNYMGDRERNTCTGAYRNTAATSTTLCACGNTCQGSRWVETCSGTTRIRETRYYCDNSYAGSTETLATCSSQCSTNYSPVHTYQGYTTCYSCSNDNVYKDTNPCSSTYNNYYVYHNGGYVNVVTQPSGVGCNYNSNCQDTGTAYCSGPNLVINQYQANSCISTSCGTRVVTYNHGPCAYSSTKTQTASGTFTRNNCNPNCDGQTSLYSQTRTETRTSFVSQADADTLANNAAYAAALDAVNAGGQAYANANGACCCWTAHDGCYGTDYYTDEINSCDGSSRNKVWYYNSTNCGYIPVNCQSGESQTDGYYAYTDCNGQFVSGSAWNANDIVGCFDANKPYYNVQSYGSC